MKMTWSIQEVWNNARTERPRVPRDYIYASEVGKPFIDVYYSMMGVEPTDPFEQRVQRIFDAGMAFEWLIKRVMDVAGILKNEEVVMETKATKDMLSVHGRCDMVVGGKPKDKADVNLPDFLNYKVDAIKEYFKANHPDGVEDVLAEIKSVNSNAFWAHKNIDEKTGYFKGYDHHKLQLVGYLIAKGIDSGRLFYVSRDDLCVMETLVSREQWEDEWYDWVKQMTKYYKDGEVPPHGEDVVFNKTKTSKFFPKGKYEVNWEIARSPYLELITGMKKDDWLDKTEKEVREKNKDIKDTKANREKAKICSEAKKVK